MENLTKPKPNDSPKPLRLQLAESVASLALGLGVNLESERIGAYIDALQDLSEVQLNHAFKKAIKSWKPAFGRTFPAPAELREYAEELSPPPVVEEPAPLSKADLLANGKRLGISKSEIADWLEQGKQKQRAHIEHVNAGVKCSCYSEPSIPLDASLPDCDPENLPKFWSLYDWQRAQLTIQRLGKK